MSQFIIYSGGQLCGSYRVPGDKSISHRAVMLGAIAEGVTHINGFLEGEDTLATLAAFQAMGVAITRNQQQVTIQGVGLHGLQPPSAPLYLGNSGTSMRLLSGLLAGQRFQVQMTGDESLSRRPMRRVTDPLTLMGARIDTSANGTAPLIIHGKQRLQGIHYTMPVASAQIKSCLLLAGLYAEGNTCVTEPAPTRDHTERMLAGFGYPVQREGQQICIASGSKLQGRQINVPGDISSAAFFMVGACISQNSDIVLEQVGINPTRVGIITILREMGADITLFNQQEVGGEPVADIRVKSSQLHGIQIPEDQVSLAIDEFPAIFIAAACAQGKTVLTGASELRVKESDRIQVMADGLQMMGIQAQPTHDGIVIQGGRVARDHRSYRLEGNVTINSHADHRVAMAFAMAALQASGTVTITDCANVATSFPQFVPLAQKAGLQINQL